MTSTSTNPAPQAAATQAPSSRSKKPLPTKEEYAAALDKATKLLNKARAHIIVDHPFFATIMLKHPMTPSMQVPTLGVNARGHIFYNPVFLADKSLDEVKFGVCHEILHYASGHPIRRGARDPKKWNIAGDMWINDTLKKSGFTLIPGVIDVPGSAERTVEDIYASFPPDDPNGGGSGQQGGQGGQQGQSGQQPPGGEDSIGDDLQDDENLGDADKSEIDAQRKLDVAEAAQIAKQRGKLPGALQDFATDTVQSKTPWYEILERYMTDRVQTDQSWARPNRRYAPDFYMPTRDSEGSMGEIVCQVDISGSVSKQEIEHYNGHLKRIAEQCRPSKVHVIYTDTQVQKHEIFEKPEDMEIRFYSGGGTRMEAGFEYIREQGIEPVVVVTLTDGYDTYTSAPEFPTVWCVSSEQTPPYGEVVHFELEG